MGRQVVRGVAVAGLAALAAACVTVVGPEGAPPPWPLGEFRKTVEIKAGDTVTIEHTLGNIVIKGWDKDEAEIVATVRPINPSEKQRVHLYTGDQLEPSIDVRQKDGVLRIRTKTLGGPWASTTMDYSLRVPASINLRGVWLEKGNVSISDVYGRVEAAVVSGGLTVKNFSGALKASLGSGRADVELLDIHKEDEVEIISQEGDIILHLQPSAGVRLTADAPKGEIASELDLGVKPPVKTVTAKLGAGGAVVTLKTLHGNIKILKTE